jgi:hypothetical protein
MKNTINLNKSSTRAEKPCHCDKDSFIRTEESLAKAASTLKSLSEWVKKK